MTFPKSIQSAAIQIQPFIRKTPFVHSKAFSDLTGADVRFKLESIQVTG
ncbi:MAG: threonine ammonia-lyase, partial [Candidatus Marinimicrobia bacterium]|nr:threonine ammonia-lyase [Candidatus Neomarinimicrobiota bacterium]